MSLLVEGVTNLFRHAEVFITTQQTMPPLHFANNHSAFGWSHLATLQYFQPV